MYEVFAKNYLGNSTINEEEKSQAMLKRCEKNKTNLGKYPNMRKIQKNSR